MAIELGGLGLRHWVLGLPLRRWASARTLTGSAGRSLGVILMLTWTIPGGGAGFQAAPPLYDEHRWRVVSWAGVNLT